MIIFRSELLFPLMAFTICCFCLSAHLAAKSAETSVIKTIIDIDVFSDCGHSGYRTSCSGIWNCAYYLCNLTHSSTPQILRISTNFDDSTCQAQGITWIWEWKTSRISVILMAIAILFELFAVASIISRKPYRLLIFRKKTVFVILSVISCSLLTLAEILEDSWTVQLTKTIKDRRPLFVQTWNTMLSIILLINLYSAHIYSLSCLDFGYDELG